MLGLHRLSDFDTEEKTASSFFPVSLVSLQWSAQTRVGSGVDIHPYNWISSLGIDLRSTDSLNVICHRRLEWKDVVHPATRGTLCRIPMGGEPQYAGKMSFPGTRWFIGLKTCSKLWAFQRTCVQVASRGNKVPAIPRVLNHRTSAFRFVDTPNADRWLQDKSYRRAVRRWLQRVSTLIFVGEESCTRPIPQDALESKPERSWPASTMQSPVIQEWTQVIRLDVGWRSST